MVRRPRRHRQNERQRQANGLTWTVSRVSVRYGSVMVPVRLLRSAGIEKGDRVLVQLLERGLLAVRLVPNDGRQHRDPHADASGGSGTRSARQTGSVPLDDEMPRLPVAVRR